MKNVVSDETMKMLCFDLGSLGGVQRGTLGCSVDLQLGLKLFLEISLSSRMSYLESI